MSDHPWGEGTGAACYECGEVGHFAKQCPYESFDSASSPRAPAQPTSCPTCGHAAPGHCEGCGSPPSEMVAAWVEQIKANLPVAMSSEGPRLYGEALARQQLAEARAGRLPEGGPELTSRAELEGAHQRAVEDDFPF